MTPPFAAFGAVWFCYFATIGLYNPYAPLWFKDLGFSTLAIGALASLQSWTRVAAPYVWGWLGDRGRRVQLVRAAALAATLASAGLLLSPTYGAVALCTVALFVANGGVVPLSEAALAAHISRGGEMDTARYGRVRVWGSIGFISAVLAGGAALQAAGTGLFPWLATALNALLLGAALRLPVVPAPAAASAGAPGVLTVLRRPAVAWFFASISFTVLAHTALYAFFSLYLDQLGHAKTTVGVLWAVSVAVEIVFFWFQGRLFGRMAPHRWLQWAAALAALRFTMVAAGAQSVAVLALAQLLHAGSFAAHHAACIVLVNRHFGGPLRGRGQALYTVLGYGLPGVVGGIGGGWMSSRWGFGSVFWAAVVAALLGLACARTAEKQETAR